MTIIETLCKEFNVQPWQVEAVIALLDEGATLPFIARCRKEQHGSLDDQQLRDISDRLNALRNIEQRRNEISESLKKLEVWTEELQAALDNAATLAQLEEQPRLSLSLDEALTRNFPVLAVTDEEAAALAMGKWLEPRGLAGVHAAVAPDGRAIALIKEKGQRLATVFVARPSTL